MHRYFAPTNIVANADIFIRPDNAVTPPMWTRHSVSDDFQVAVPGWVAGICGVVTTQPWGIDSPETIGDDYITLAPLCAVNSFLIGTSDFWAVTNECSTTFVWKDLAFNRNPSNLVSFSATIYEWGDIDFTYGNVPDDGFSAFVKIGSETQDLTPFAASGQAVRLEKNLEQNDEWWLENYPEICYTNAAGELVFDYDTNEWFFVECFVRDDAYEQALKMYREKARALSSDVVRIEKYTVMVEAKRNPLDEDNDEKRRPDLFDKYIQMQKEQYGAETGLQGWAIDELPEGVSPEDVVFLTEASGTVTNIFHWVIDDKSRVVAKIGLPPDPGDFGLDEDHFPLAARNRYSGRHKIHLRIVFAVERGSVVRFKENDKIINTWALEEKETGSYLVPCRSGFAYDVHASKGFAYVDYSSNEESVFWDYAIGRHTVNFHRKLSLAVEGVALTNASFAMARAMMRPPVRNGGYSWESSNNIRLVPVSNSNRAGVFLENGDAGYVKCIWDNGESGKWNLCATGEVSVAANPDYTNLTQFVEFDAAPRVLVFEDAHLDIGGNRVPASSNLVSTLSCVYNGNRSGTFELDKVSSPDVTLSDNGCSIPLPYSWDVSGGGNDAIRNFTVGGLSPGDEAQFRLRFTSSSVPGGIDHYATIRAVSLEVVAERTWPEERHRRVFGPREVANFSVDGISGEASWRSLIGSTNGNVISVAMPQFPIDTSMTLIVDGYEYTFPISIIAPSACIGTNAVPMTDSDWLEVSTNALAVGEIGAGLRINLKLMPDYVSFFGLRTMEGFAPASDKQGYFTHIDMSAVNHDAQNGADRVNVVQEGNLAGVDRAGMAYRVDELPQPWSDGSYSFNIPYYWWVDGSAQTNLLSTTVQMFRLFANGDAEVSKFGWTAHRGTNGVQNVTGEALP